jgi:hypothetical protein
MVTVIGWQKRQKENGESFNVLNLQGGIELIKSLKTGKFYATARKTNLVCTFNDDVCESLVKKELPGTIEKMECEPYEYQIPSSGEVVTLNYNYVFNPEANSVEEHVFEEAK